MTAFFAIAFLVLAIIANLAHFYDAALVWAVLFFACVYDNRGSSK
jgi:hypothetical protein